MSRTCYILFLVIGLTHGKKRLKPLVDTQQEVIRGLWSQDGNYSMFLGIPYAMVDETNPFGAAIPHPPFESIFNAADDSAKCPQINEFSGRVEGSLDCLHLNIYVPNNATTSKKLPVLVWIHGGAFDKGYSGRFIYGPKYLIRYDVIVVTFNYRLGPYGFLCLDIPQVPGNQGLKDQVMAFRWIKDNIGYFGGDAERITAMGESAGAASVELHILSYSEKLFHQAILQSGSSLAPWAIEPPNNKKLFLLSEKLDIKSTNLLETLSYLAVVDIKQVIAASSELNLQYRPCVENSFNDIEPFLNEDPENSKFSKAKNMHVLIGFNSREQLLVNTKKNFYIKNYFHKTLNTIFNLNPTMLDIVRHFYIGDKPISKDVKLQLIDFQSDIFFNYPIQRSVLKYIKNGAAKVYHYVFSYSGQRNFVKSRLNIEEEGACHADEIGYLFDISYYKEVSFEDQLVIDRITTLWTNFVKNGNPTPWQMSELIPITWSSVTEDVLHYLNINFELSMGERPFYDRMAFWDIFYQANRKKKDNR